MGTDNYQQYTGLHGSRFLFWNVVICDVDRSNNCFDGRRKPIACSTSYNRELSNNSDYHDNHRGSSHTVSLQNITIEIIPLYLFLLVILRFCMSQDLICKVIYDKTENCYHFESAEVPGLKTLEEQIEIDKRYGKMLPRNGKYFTFRAMAWNDKFITDRQINRGITLAWQQAEIEIPIDVRKAKDNEIPDFKIYFRATADDPHLSRNTVMYQYYPINDITNPNRGVCVVNTDFDFTIHGNLVSMFLIDPDHYTEDTKVKAPTIDFDEVYEHEGPGHGLGLPHSTHDGKVMSRSVGTMAKFLHDETPLETIPRMIAKYGKRGMLSIFRKRWRNWYRVRSDKY